MPNDTDRVIGKLEEFKNWAKGEFKGIRSDVKDLKEDIESLNKLKWQIYGGAAVITTSFTLFFEIIKRFLLKHAM